jgi:hypothetical protein
MSGYWRAISSWSAAWRATLAGRPIPLHRELDPLHERLRNDLGAQQVEPEMGKLVRLRFSRCSWHEVAPNDVETNGRAHLDIIGAHDMARHPEAFGSFRADQSRIQRAVCGMREPGCGSARPKDDPG